jgi:hypothetical protein
VIIVRQRSCVSNGDGGRSGLGESVWANAVGDSGVGKLRESVPVRVNCLVCCHACHVLTYPSWQLDPGMQGGSAPGLSQ